MTVAVAAEKAVACFASGDKHPVARRPTARVAATASASEHGWGLRQLMRPAQMRRRDNFLCMTEWNTELWRLSIEKQNVQHDFLLSDAELQSVIGC